MSAMIGGGDRPGGGVFDCRRCGACCDYSHEWPRFTLETDAALARIPAAMVAAGGNAMRCAGERCVALAGEVGVAATCTIHAIRPIVCRDCEPGDDACLTARRRHGLPDG